MKKNISTAMNIDGRLVSDNVQVANAFNSHFIKSIRSLIDLLGISSRNENNSSSLESLNKSEKIPLSLLQLQNNLQSSFYVNVKYARNWT